MPLHAADLEYSDFDSLPTGWPHEQGVKSLGYGILGWAETYLAQPDGDMAGNAWTFRDSQARFVAWWYAIDENGGFLFNHGQIVLSKGPLAHDTPVNTPTGWRNHGDLQPGDEVYALDGSVTRVTARHADVLEPCYRVTLGSGEEFVATASHRWRVREFNGTTRVEKTLTTQQIASAGATYDRALTEGKTKAVNPGVARFRVLQTPGFDGAHADLPLDPYVLGYWLGDGDTDAARVTIHEDDLGNLQEHLTAAGMKPYAWTRKPGSPAGRMTIDAIGPLRAMGLIGNKHIPEAYMRASREQRMALLAGLVDSDGHVDKGGRIEISQKLRDLSEQIQELAIGLGLAASLKTGDAMLNGRVVGKRHRVCFSGIQGCARLPRKAARLAPYVEPREGFSTVVKSVEEVEPVLANCVMIEHESHMYLAGRGMVPSHNSGKSPLAAILSICELAGPVVFAGFDANGEPVGMPHPSPLIALAAVSYEQTGNMSELLSSALSEGPASEVIADMDPGIMRVRTKNGAIFRIAASDRSAEGQRTTSAFLDETQHWVKGNKGDKLSRAIRRNLMKTGGRALELTNCWEPGEDSVAENTHRRATDAFGRSPEGLRAQKRILRWHPTIHVEDLSNTADLRGALDTLYGDFPWVDVQRFIDEAEQDMSASEIRRFFLNQITSADDALVTADEWDACRIPEDEWRPLSPGDTVTLGFDGGKSDDSTALVACRVEDRTFHLIGLWERPVGYRPSGKERWTVNREVVDMAVQDARTTFDVAGFYGDVAQWESYIDKWSAELLPTISVKASNYSAVGWDMRGRLQANTRGTENIVAGIIDAQIGHNGDPRLRKHVLNARRRHNTYGLSFGKESRESPNKVDAFAAMQLADMARADFVMSGRIRKKRSKVLVY